MTQTLRLSGLSCASCVARAERALAAVPGVTDARVNLATGLAHVDGAATPSGLIEAVRDAGYGAEVPEGEDNGAAREVAVTRDLGRATLWAGVLTLPVLIFEMGGHIWPPIHHLVMRSIGQEAWWWLQAALITIVLAGPGRQFFSIGVPALLKRAPEMNALVALGTGAAWIFSMAALLVPDMFPAGTRAVYFEAAGVIVTLILLGRWLEAKAKGRTGEAIRGLAALRPDTAWRVDGENLVEVSPDDLRVDDVIQLKPGARVPADAVVTDGTSYVDEAMLTGEPHPVAKAAGDEVIGGTLNGGGVLTARISRAGADTVLSGIIRTVEEAQAAKLPIQALVDRVTAVFVPVVMALAVLAVLVWWLWGPEPALNHALVVGVSVLIVACPCAMGLATPVSIIAGTGRAAELGVLFRKGDALQRLAEVQMVAFDKTGTLTEGRMTARVEAVADGFKPEDVIKMAAAVEEYSEHPVAEAIRALSSGRKIAAKRLKVHVGLGLQASVGDRSVLVGSTALLAEAGIDLGALEAAAQQVLAAGQSPVMVAIDGQPAAVLSVSDPIKPDAKDAIAVLHANGVSVAMISGDVVSTAERVADELGIDHVMAGLRPDGKVAALDALRDRNGAIAFVGDGINDAPALSHADVGIALGTGTDIAIEAADVVLFSGAVGGVPRGHEVARTTLSNIKQNLFWAFGYNALLIPVAAGALYPFLGLLLSPALAGGAMALSSVFVVANALRLRRAVSFERSQA